MRIGIFAQEIPQDSEIIEISNPKMILCLMLKQENIKFESII